MSTTRRFCCDDLLKFNNVNLDVLTETVRVPVGEERGFPKRRVAPRSFLLSWDRDLCTEKWHVTFDGLASPYVSHSRFVPVYINLSLIHI